MSKISLSELIEQDIKDLKGLLKCEKYNLSEELLGTQTRAILFNLQDHLKEFIKSE